MHQYKDFYNNENLNEYKDNIIDAIFVLAGGLNENKKVHEWVIRRLDLAYHINFISKNKKIKK